jgi:ankyrin repeat protein
VSTADFEGARQALLEGRLDDLAHRLDTRPTLVHQRCDSSEPPYDGYFHGATLLHHVAGNPAIRPLPTGLTEAVALLLDRGADVDAVTRAGPSQPDDVGWTTLGLVGTSAAARESGMQMDLMALLAEAGADLDARNGGAVMGALYYGESAAARWLADRGCRLDLISAAGVGDTETLDRELAKSAEELLRSPRLTHYARATWPTDLTAEESEPHVRGMALVYGALHGRIACLDRLLAAGVDPNHRPPFEHGGTALHWAVMGDRAEAVRVLLDGGADPSLRDEEYDATPAEWAAHLSRPAAAKALAAHRS